MDVLSFEWCVARIASLGLKTVRNDSSTGNVFPAFSTGRAPSSWFHVGVVIRRGCSVRRVLTFEQPRRFASFVSLIQRGGVLLEILGRRISSPRWVARW